MHNVGGGDIVLTAVFLLWARTVCKSVPQQLGPPYPRIEKWH